MTFLPDRAIKAAAPALAKIASGPGLVLRPLLWLIGAAILVLRPALRRQLSEEAAEEDRKKRLRKDKNDLYPLW